MLAATHCIAISHMLSILVHLMTAKTAELPHFLFGAMQFGGNFLLHIAEAVKCGTCRVATSVVKTAWKPQFFPPRSLEGWVQLCNSDNNWHAGLFVAYICEMDFSGYNNNNTTSNTWLNAFQSSDSTSKRCPTECEGTVMWNTSAHMTEN